MRYEGIGHWLSSRHVGLSSSALAAAMLGYVPDHEPAYPHNSSDFGRCVFLVGCAGADATRDGLDALAAVSGPWFRLNAEWASLMELYETDRATCHKRIRHLVCNGDEGSGSFTTRKDKDGRWDRFRVNS